MEIGYKSIGSFAVDFRQYLNTGNNLPKANPTLAGQEHQSYDYVRNASLNTAATVDITLDLPSNTFDAYYLKLILVPRTISNPLRQSMQTVPSASVPDRKFSMKPTRAIQTETLHG